MVRKGIIKDLDVLQEIMKNAFSVWKYSEDNIKKITTTLAITEDFINNAVLYVEEINGKIEGFFGVVPFGELNEAKFYVNPANIKTGIGKILWQHVIQDLEKTELEYITIVIDGNAIGFYEKLGCINVGEQPSVISGGKYTPIMRYFLKK